LVGNLQLDYVEYGKARFDCGGYVGYGHYGVTIVLSTCCIKGRLIIVRMDEILTAKDIARELHCSKAQTYKLLNGEVRGCSKLPAISIGRKKIVRRRTFEKWKQDNESSAQTLVTTDPSVIFSTVRNDAV